MPEPRGSKPMWRGRSCSMWAGRRHEMLFRELENVDQLVAVRRLEHVTVEAGGDHLHAVRGRPPAGERGEVEPVLPGSPAELARDLEPAHVG